MIPVDQTALHDPPDVIGNCFRACVASILEIGIDDLPDFERLMFDEEGDWFQCFREWAEDQGWGILVVWGEAVELRCPVGLEDAYCIATGPSPRFPDEAHSVVYRGGELVHDPYPTGDGLEGYAPWEYMYLLPRGK